MRINGKENYIRLLFRNIMILICHYSGIISLWRRLNRNKIIILMLHGVSTANAKTTWMPLRSQLDSRILDNVLKVLKEHYQFISMDEAFAMLSGSMPMKHNCIALTFDDGYRNNVNIALPILKKYAAPAMVYVAAGHIDKRIAFWFDRLDYAIMQLPKGVYEIELNGSVMQIDCTNRDTRIETYKNFRKAVKHEIKTDFEMLKIIENITVLFEKKSGKSIYDIFEKDPWTSLLSWEEIKQASQRNLMNFGSHTVNHIRIAMVDNRTAEYQLTTSKRMIEQKTNKKCRHFAYPNGNYDMAVAGIVEKCGYDTAVTTVYGMNKPGDNLMTLKRYSFPVYDDPKKVLFLVSGLSNMFTLFKRKLLNYW